jgi:hypothetical protein
MPREKGIGWLRKPWMTDTVGQTHTAPAYGA